MKIFRGEETPFKPADMKSFVGAARTRLLASDQQPSPVHVYQVAFDSGARTNWHTHSGPQWLFVTEGRIRVQRWGEPSQDVEAGDTVMVAPGEKHWHGAVPGSRGVHVAVNLDVKTTWLEPVRDEEYDPAYDRQ
ncbi:MAG TPA: cupin domain-containing protein [Vicinamibacterales bacterium]|jgi:quercetin dioxygenase-like cupin family protein